MRIALIIPKNSTADGKSFYDFEFYSKFLLSRRYLSYILAIPTLLATTPNKHEIRVFDENIEDIDFGWQPDLVGITVRTMFATRAYAISEMYRKRGAKTVLGGIHVSMCPDEALEHCDTVVSGEAENTWPTVLQHAEEGRLERFYKADRSTNLKAFPMPKRSSLSIDRYFSHMIQTTRGCPFKCEFCSVHAFNGQNIRSKTVAQVVQEIMDINQANAKYKRKQAIFFVDDNIVADKSLARELFLALKPHNINWMCQAPISISREDELLKLMKDSGCGAIFIGFESISKENLASMHKKMNQKYDFSDAIKTIQSHGILVHGSFIVGYDRDSEDTFQELIDFIQESNLLMPLINILTPFPGTKLFARLEEEGRLLHKDWNQYDTKHVVFMPASMPPEDLLAGFKKIVRSIYSYDSILKKLRHYWDIDFWRCANKEDPVKFTYRLLFALRLCSLLFSFKMKRSQFILRILPNIFKKKVRISTVVTMMAYNDFAYSL
jgi:radical SAM superfamily enzyme YgiQ (UPF0313 family)